MRLVCPNCGAQYEVDDKVIPEGGRDVQCSNCGHTWFQNPAGEDGAETPAAAGPAGSGAPRPAPPAQQETPPEPAPEPVPDTAPKTATEPAPDAGPQAGHQATPQGATPQPDRAQTSGEQPAADLQAPEKPTEEPPEQPAATRAADRQELDENLRELLREEAEREARVRERERQQLETQDDLGLDEAGSASNQRAVAAQERMARLRGLDTGDDTTTSEGSNTRRDLLPDIEEINSSLTSIGSTEVIDDFAEPAPRGSFGRGFVLMLLLAAIIVALYIYAPLIGEKAPAMAPYLEAYVALIDQARAWIDRMVGLALSKLGA